MEITLEKIELVKDRTGVSYKEAKEALEAVDGSVVDAIINIEENIDNRQRMSIAEQGTALVDTIKDTVKKGNVSKILVKNKDGEVLINIPVNAGIIGAVVAPWGVIAGMIASFGFKCVVEVIKTDGTIIDVSDMVNEKIAKGVEKGSAFAIAAKSKSNEIIDKVKGSETFDKVKDKAQSAADDMKDAAAGLKEVAEEKINQASQSVKNKIAKDDMDDAADDVDDADDVDEEEFTSADSPAEDEAEEKKKDEENK